LHSPRNDGPQKEDLGQGSAAEYQDIDAPAASVVKVSYKRKVMSYSDL
jgi:hypothetical protein